MPPNEEQLSEMEKQVDDYGKMTEQQRKAEIQRRIERSAAAQRVFTGKDGELILNELKLFCGGDSMLCGAQNEMTLAMAAGKQDVWRFIQNLLKDDPEKYLKELKDAEAKKRRE